MTHALIALILLYTPAIPSVGSSRNDERPVASSLATSTLESGTLVRLVKMDGNELEGTLVEVSETEISLSTELGLTVLPEAYVFRIYEVEKRRGKGALRGLLVGLGITAALGTATLTQATEKGEGALGFGIGLLFAVPISTGVGVILSPDGETLVYENPGVVPATRAPPKPEPEVPRQPPVPTALTEPVMPAERPRIPRSFYVTLGGGSSAMTAQFPGPVTEFPAPSSTFSVQAKYRASEHLGFGAEVLFMETDAWRWQSDVLEASFAETRKIVAPGFKAFYSPIVGRHELVFNGGVSVFKQDAVEIAEDGEPSYPITSTKLDPYMTLGAEYHFYVGRHFGVGGEIQYYAGSNVPSQLLRYSASVSFRTNPPPER